MATIGLDVGGTNLRGALIGFDGVIQRRLSRPVERRREAFVDSLVGMARELDCAEADGIGIGLPARIDPSDSRLVSAGYLDIAGLPIATMVREATGLPTVLENDCCMALFGEMAMGAAAGERDVVMLTIGTGVGGAVAVDGRLLRGAGFAGQLGHLTVDPSGDTCNCGRRGCVETTSSGTALGRHLRSAGLAPTLSPRDLLAAANAGDEVAVGVLAAWIGPLRCAIDSLIATVDPAVVVLGGGLGVAAHACLGYAPAGSAWFQRPVRPAALGDDAGMIGSALHARPAAATVQPAAALVA